MKTIDKLKMAGMFGGLGLRISAPMLNSLKSEDVARLSKEGYSSEQMNQMKADGEITGKLDSNETLLNLQHRSGLDFEGASIQDTIQGLGTGMMLPMSLMNYSNTNNKMYSSANKSKERAYLGKDSISNKANSLVGSAQNVSSLGRSVLQTSALASMFGVGGASAVKDTMAPALFMNPTRLPMAFGPENIGKGIGDAVGLDALSSGGMGAILPGIGAAMLGGKVLNKGLGMLREKAAKNDSRDGAVNSLGNVSISRIPMAAMYKPPRKADDSSARIIQSNSVNLSNQGLIDIGTSLQLAASGQKISLLTGIKSILEDIYDQKESKEYSKNVEFNGTKNELLYNKENSKEFNSEDLDSGSQTEDNYASKDLSRTQKFLFGLEQATARLTNTFDIWGQLSNTLNGKSSTKLAREQEQKYRNIGSASMMDPMAYKKEYSKKHNISTKVTDLLHYDIRTEISGIENPQNALVSIGALTFDLLQESFKVQLQSSKNFKFLSGELKGMLKDQEEETEGTKSLGQKIQDAILNTLGYIPGFETLRGGASLLKSGVKGTISAGMKIKKEITAFKNGDETFMGRIKNDFKDSLVNKFSNSNEMANEDYVKSKIGIVNDKDSSELYYKYMVDNIPDYHQSMLNETKTIRENIQILTKATAGVNANIQKSDKIAIDKKTGDLDTQDNIDTKRSNEAFEQLQNLEEMTHKIKKQDTIENFVITTLFGGDKNLSNQTSEHLDRRYDYLKDLKANLKSTSNTTDYKYKNLKKEASQNEYQRQKDMQTLNDGGQLFDDDEQKTEDLTNKTFRTVGTFGLNLAAEWATDKLFKKQKKSTLTDDRIAELKEKYRGKHSKEGHSKDVPNSGEYKSTEKVSILPKDNTFNINSIKPKTKLDLKSNNKPIDTRIVNTKKNAIHVILDNVDTLKGPQNNLNSINNSNYNNSRTSNIKNVKLKESKNNPDYKPTFPQDPIISMPIQSAMTGTSTSESANIINKFKEDKRFTAENIKGMILDKLPGSGVLNPLTKVKNKLMPHKNNSLSLQDTQDIQQYKKEKDDSINREEENNNVLKEIRNGINSLVECQGCKIKKFDFKKKQKEREDAAGIFDLLGSLVAGLFGGAALGFLGKIKSFFKGIVSKITGVFKNGAKLITGSFTKGFDLIKTVFKGGFAKIGMLIAGGLGLKSLFNNDKTKVPSKTPTMLSKAGSVLGLGALGATLTKGFDKVKTSISNLGNIFKGSLGSISKLLTGKFGKLIALIGGIFGVSSLFGDTPKTKVPNPIKKDITPIKPNIKSSTSTGTPTGTSTGTVLHPNQSIGELVDKDKPIPKEQLIKEAKSLKTPEAKTNFLNKVKGIKPGFSGYLTAGLTAVELGEIWMDDKKTTSGKDGKLDKTAEVAGGLGGMYAGSALGAALGAPLAPFTFGLSSVVGGLAGGALGYMGGSKIGDKTGDFLFKKKESKANEKPSKTEDDKEKDIEKERLNQRITRINDTLGFNPEIFFHDRFEIEDVDLFKRISKGDAAFILKNENYNDLLPRQRQLLRDIEKNEESPLKKKSNEITNKSDIKSSNEKNGKFQEQPNISDSDNVGNPEMDPQAQKYEALNKSLKEDPTLRLAMKGTPMEKALQQYNASKGNPSKITDKKVQGSINENSKNDSQAQKYEALNKSLKEDPTLRLAMKGTPMEKALQQYNASKGIQGSINENQPRKSALRELVKERPDLASSFKGSSYQKELTNSKDIIKSNDVLDAEMLKTKPNIEKEKTLIETQSVSTKDIQPTNIFKTERIEELLGLVSENTRGEHPTRLAQKESSESKWKEKMLESTSNTNSMLEVVAQATMLGAVHKSGPGVDVDGTGTFTDKLKASIHSPYNRYYTEVKDGVFNDAGLAKL